MTSGNPGTDSGECLTGHVRGCVPDATKSLSPTIQGFASFRVGGGFPGGPCSYEKGRALAEQEAERRLSRGGIGELKSNSKSCNENIRPLTVPGAVDPLAAIGDFTTDCR